MPAFGTGFFVADDMPDAPGKRFAGWHNGHYPDDERIAGMTGADIQGDKQTMLTEGLTSVRPSLFRNGRRLTSVLL